MTVLEEQSRCKKYKYLGVPQKRLTREKDGGYDYGSTRPSIKKY